MSDFDPKPLVIGKKRAGVKTARTGSEINGMHTPNARRQGTAAEKKLSAGHNKAHQGTDHQLIAKIARDNEVLAPARISLNVGQAMRVAREERGLTQTKLAQDVNEKKSVIQTYESGSAIPSPQILGKLERILLVKLRGSEIGKKVGSPKKTEPVANPGPARGA